MMNKILKTISLLSILFSLNHAFAGGNGGGGGGGQTDPCTGLIVNATSALIDPSTGTAIQDLSISRSANVTGTCNFFVVIDNNGGATYNDRYLTFGGSNQIQVQFYNAAGHSASNIIRSYNEITSTSQIMIQGSIKGSSTTPTGTFTIYPYIDPTTNVTPGSYTANFTISIYGWDGTHYSGLTPYDFKSVNYKFTKSGTVSLSLVDSSTSPFNAADVSQTLDFGNLTSATSNAYKDFYAVLMYNQGYTLQMTSANGSKIKNTNSIYTAQNTVDYSLAVDGTTYTLPAATPVTVKSGSGPSPNTGTYVKVGVTLGTVGPLNPGSYTDTVTIKIISQ
jgi:spore coat protein U-like protein